MIKRLCCPMGIITFLIVFLMSGCADSKSQDTSSQMQANSREAGSWLTVSENYGEESFSLKTGAHEHLIPFKLSWPEEKRWPHRIPATNASVLGGRKLGSEDIIVVQYDTGSGVSNPIVCMYKKRGEDALLQYVWNQQLTSIYGFNSVEFSEETITVKAEYPERGGQKAHYSEVSLPWPQGSK